MSIIMDALEKAQRDKDRKKGEVTEENLLHPAKAVQPASSAGKYVLFILAGNIILFLALGSVYLYREDRPSKASIVRENHEKRAESEKYLLTEKTVEAAVDKENVQEKQANSISQKHVSLYNDELVLDNGLKLKVDGVYMDSGVSHALIGPEIVKAGDTIEGVVSIIHVDFTKVEIEYKGKRFYLLSK